MRDEFEAFKYSIIRIAHANGAIVGAGFLFAQQYCLTCAHVVSQVLSPLEENGIPQGLIDLDFPQVNLEREMRREPQLKLKARVVIWRPYRSGCITKAEVGDDIAVLEIEGKLPIEVQPIQLLPAKKPWGHPFVIYGFPEGHDPGFWTKGKLLEVQGQGWVQMKPEARPIEQGFSGAPVWDDLLKGVIGMAVASENDSQGVSTAFAIPTEILVNFALKELELLDILSPLEGQYFPLLQQAYLACRPKQWERTVANTLREILDEIFELMPLESLGRFVAELIIKKDLPENERNELRQWGNRRIENFANILVETEQRVQAQTETINEDLTYLMLRIEESKQHPGRYFLSAVFIPDRKVYEPLTGDGSYALEMRVGDREALSLTEIDELLPSLVEDFLNQSNKYRTENSGSLRIVFFLPRELFNEPFTVCEVQDEDELPIPLAAEYQVLVRSEKRLQKRLQKKVQVSIYLG